MKLMEIRASVITDMYLLENMSNESSAVFQKLRLEWEEYIVKNYCYLRKRKLLCLWEELLLELIFGVFVWRNFSLGPFVSRKIS